MVETSAPGSRIGIFITSGKSWSGWLARQSVAMPPEGSRSVRVKPSMTEPMRGVSMAVPSVLAADLQPQAEPVWQAGSGDLAGGLLRVIGHAEHRHLAPVGIDQRQARGRIAVARLADGADHHDMAADH